MPHIPPERIPVPHERGRYPCYCMECKARDRCHGFPDYVHKLMTMPEPLRAQVLSGDYKTKEKS